jgi:hypothetical protein
MDRQRRGEEARHDGPLPELGFDPENDNEADAIALLYIACNKVPALPIERQVKKRRSRRTPTRPRPQSSSIRSRSDV